MNKIAGNNYDEGNREDELGFDPYRDGLPKQLEDAFFEEETKNYLKETSEKDCVTSSTEGNLYKRGLMVIYMKCPFVDNETSDYFDKIHSRLILHKDPKDYNSRESAVAFLNKKTHGAFGLINTNEECEPDNKTYNVSDLYGEYKQFLKDNNKYFPQGIHYVYKLSDFKTLLRQNTIVKSRGQRYKNKQIRSDTVIGLPKKRY